MQPLHALISENLSLAIKEIEDNYYPEDLPEYMLLVDFQKKWSNVISNYRMYLLNRFNSFQESFLVNQMKNIDEHLNIIQLQLDKLMRLTKMKN